MTEYLWQSQAWPHFRWDAAAVLTAVGKTRLAQGRLLGRLEALGFQEAVRVEAEALVQEALKTSEIEGERLSRDSVCSSVARRLGLDITGLPAPGGSDDGLVEVLFDTTNRGADHIGEGGLLPRAGGSPTRRVRYHRLARLVRGLRRAGCGAFGGGSSAGGP